ncbi:MAG: ParB N-terminal domain-containing protein [Pseudomonadota bacterium]
MSYRLIKISDLLVSNTNDRHGELADEQEAIEWLLRNHTQHMLNLAKDIAHSGVIYEPPIVAKEGEQYRVFDGNRRVASIKLLNDPKKIPETLGRRLWLAESALWRERKVDAIECRVESDQSLIDAILERRHTGSRKGVGQSTWDNEAKQNFLRRTGKISSLTTAELIEDLLRSNNQLPAGTKVLRSKIDRLFSASKFRAPYGFDIVKNEIVFKTDKAAALSALRKTVMDLNKKEVTLADIWDETKKLEYIEECRKQGFLPVPEKANEHPTPKPKGKKPDKPKPPPKPSPKPTKLIPHTAATKFEWSADWSRLREVWEELQFNLEFDRHQNSISVMFRVLIELVIVDYSDLVTEKNIDSDKALTDRLVIVAKDLAERGILNADQLKDAEVHIHNERALSPKLLHKYVHSPHSFPSVDHLNSMWKNLEAVLLASIAEIETAR